MWDKNDYPTVYQTPRIRESGSQKAWGQGGNWVCQLYTVFKKRKFPPRNRQTDFFQAMRDKNSDRNKLVPKSFDFAPVYYGTKKFGILIIVGKFWACFGAESYLF